MADDETGLRESVERTLRREGFRVVQAEDGQAALDLLRRGGVDLLLADLRMPGLDGLELLRAVKLLAPEVEVVVLSGHGTVEEAVQAMKEGAYDFLTKPIERAQLVRAIRQALEHRALVLENRSLQRRLDELVGAGEIIGESPAIKEVLALVKQVAPTSATVLIQGESGTGKELVARALHEGSPRRGRPFIRVNCAALPETLLESELFGYERGAFTGATARKEGRFELADLADLPPTVSQAEPATRVVSIPLGMPLDEVEQRLIEETLRLTKGNKELAAKLLGIASRTIYRKLKE